MRAFVWAGWVVFVAVFCVGCACGPCGGDELDEVAETIESEKKAKKKGDKAAKAAEEKKAEAPKSAIPKGPVALFVSRSDEVSALVDGKFHRIEGLAKGIDTSISRPRGGAVLITARDTVWKLRKGKLSKVVDRAALGFFPKSAAIGPKGTVWVAGSNGVAHKKKGKDKWVIEDKDKKIGADKWLVYRMDVGDDGRVFVRTSRNLFVRSAKGKWAKATLPKSKRQLYTGNLVLGPDNTVFMMLQGKLKQLQDDLTFAKVTNTAGSYKGSHTAMGPDGTLAQADSSYNSVFIRNPEGKKRKLKAPKDFPTGVNSVAKLNPFVDEEGRVWVAGKFGVSVVDGDKIHTLFPGIDPNFPDEVHQIVVVGKGLEIPKLESKLATIKGRVLSNGQPFEGARVEFCPRPSTTKFSRKDTPCKRSLYVKSGKTDAEGRFVIKDVMHMSLGDAIEIDGKWLVSNKHKCCRSSKDIIDVGDLTVGR